MTAEQLNELKRLNEQWANDPPSPANERSIQGDVMDALPDVLDHIKQLTAERDEEKAIVDRVWAALGISTYEQAKPLAIDEHVKRIIAERDSLRFSLNICTGAAGLGDSEELCGWIDRVKAERDAALKACKFYRDTLSCIVGFDEDSPWDDPGHCAKDALSRCDCGKGYHADSEWDAVVGALNRILNFPVHSEPVGGAYAMQDIASEALAHAESLLKK